MKFDSFIDDNHQLYRNLHKNAYIIKNEQYYIKYLKKKHITQQQKQS